MRSFIALFGTLLVGWTLGCGSPTGPSLVAWSEPGTGDLLIRNVRVLDVVGGDLGAPADVYVDQGRIVSISPIGSATTRSRTPSRVVDGAGATLLPGLIDMHGHISANTGPSWEAGFPTPDANMQAYVYAGVTTVFDPADASGDAFSRRDDVAAGRVLGPQIFAVGPILTVPDGHPISIVKLLAPAWIRWYIAPRVAEALADEADVHRVVDRLAEEGADGLKIVIDRIPLDAPRMSRERARQVVERGRLHGLRTVVHIGTTQDAVDAASAGVSLWVHGVYKERIPDDQIAVLADFGIPMVTTSEVFDSYGRVRSGPRIATRLEKETVAADTLNAFYPIPDDLDLGSLQDWVDLMAATREVRLDNVARLHRAGVTILAGSDVQSGVFPGASLHREIATLVEAGLSPIEAIRAATLDAARYLADDPDPDFGIVAVGKRADLLLVDGDPTKEIDALDNIREVILKGMRIERTPIASSN